MEARISRHQLSFSSRAIEAHNLKTSQLPFVQTVSVPRRGRDLLFSVEFGFHPALKISPSLAEVPAFDIVHQPIAADLDQAPSQAPALERIRIAFLKRFEIVGAPIVAAIALFRKNAD